ncbi:hypothetical protein ASPZODRAFT_97766 [Penicilliopsis zonata CBS 506.65]|uniref:DUF7721 domain-containing protein n=1 Tax=Penicilliopsis zonata CBS 506.65 TaxID=1073090 RepID=A0A1L9SGH1_9EURO|nr:hypothetical protein ASPZODRAFT_97766 [Penicilliopsis zonata CBS 506.65]OJJ46144.1 hypothetical protein ASPZODRAFT_97766 [Penicilliopsis zonata CBS 506.65]
MSYNGYNGGGASASYYDNNNDFSDELRGAAQHAERGHSAPDSSSLFGEAVSFIQGRASEYMSGGGGGGSSGPAVDENQMVQAHQAVYGQGSQGGGQQHSSETLGAGAAMQALKMFGSGSSGSSGSMNEFIGMAMSQAGNLWDQHSASGSVAGSKQSAINSAAEMAMKMYMKSGGSGLGGTGGPAGLMSLASKFL